MSAFLRARRPRNLILVALVLIMIGLGIGAVEWIDSYQPLTLGNGLRYPAGARNDPAGGSFVAFHKRRPFEFGVTVLNTGVSACACWVCPREYISSSRAS